MRVATWNTYRDNPKALQGAATLMGKHDVLCLQEVHHNILDEMLKLAPHHHVSEECTWKKGQSYVVTLSKHPIIRAKCVQHRHWPSLRNALQKQKEGRFFQRLDIEHNGAPWRIVNVHLPLNASPFCRMGEWARMWGETASHGRNIICGDFNTFAGPIWALMVGPFMGFRMRDVFINERRRLQQFIAKTNFISATPKQRTQMHLPYQLDFLLHSESLTTQHAERWPERLGSDHWPLSAHFTTEFNPERSNRANKL